MKHLNLFQTWQDFLNVESTLIKPWVIYVKLDTIDDNGSPILDKDGKPVKLNQYSVDFVVNSNEPLDPENPSEPNEDEIITVTKWEFDGTIYNTKEQALFAMFNLMNSQSDFTNLIFESGKTTKYTFYENGEDTIWYDEQTDGWQLYNDSTTYTTDIQDFIEDLKSNNMIYKCDYDCVIDGNLYLKDNILSAGVAIQQDTDNIIEHTEDWSDFVEEFTETVPAGELPDNYYIVMPMGCGSGVVAKTISEAMQYIGEEYINQFHTEEELYNADIVALYADEYGQIISIPECIDIYNSNYDGFGEYICKVSEWNWDGEIEITKYRVTINDSEIGVYNKLGEDFVWDNNYFTNKGDYAYYNPEWYDTNENTAYRAIYDYLYNNWQIMTLDKKIKWLPYVNYSVYYPIMENVNGTDLNSYIFTEDIDSTIAFSEETLKEYAENKIKKFVENLTDVEVWNISSTDYTIGCPDYSFNYDTLEAAVEEQYHDYKATTVDYEVCSVNGVYYTDYMLDTLVSEDITNYQSGNPTTLDFNSLIKEVKE